MTIKSAFPTSELDPNFLFQYLFRSLLSYDCTFLPSAAVWKPINMLYSSNNGNTREIQWNVAATQRNLFLSWKTKRDKQHFKLFSLSTFCRKKCNCFFSREAALSVDKIISLFFIFGFRDP